MIRYAGEVLAVIGALILGIRMGRDAGPMVGDRWCCAESAIDPVARVGFNPRTALVQCHSCGTVWLPLASS